MRAICLSINTIGYTSISISVTTATQRTENTRQNELGLQYRVGTSGTFTNVASSTYQNQMTPTNTSGTSSVKAETISFSLPTACENQSVVQLRWVIRDVTGSGNRPGFSVDDISITGTSSSTPTLTISHAGLTEANLNGAVINLALANETFADGSLSSGNFTLSNAPAGTTVNSVSYLTNTTATLTLDYDGTDFDVNVTTFNVTIAGAELTLGSPLTSNNLTITATIEVAPTVTTNDAITLKTSTTATWGGNVSADGGEAVTQKGIVWNTLTGPTIDNSKTNEGGGTGAITGSMSGLSPNTLYYVRAYATNSVGTSYGTEKSFTTNGLSAPTSGSATNVSSTGFTANWSALDGAASYRLDVSTSSTFGIEAVSENFSGFTTNAGTTDRSLFLDTYLQTSGWTGAKIYEMVGYAKLGTSSAAGVITTPTIDLSGNGGIWTLTFDLGIYGTDAGYVQVMHAPDGTTFSQVGSDILPPATLTSQAIGITGGTANSKIRIQAKDAASNRFYLDNILIGYSDNLSNYNNLTVNALSQSVTGLTPGTTYYYRVRGFSTNSTSSNSSTITVTTANNSQSSSVSGNGTVSIGGSTGIGSLTFSGVTQSGNILVSRFNTTPQNVSGVAGNVSQYRWVIENSGVVFGSCEFRINLGDIANHGVLENADDIVLYKRSTPGTGAFSRVGTMTYNKDGAPGNQSGDYLTLSGITSFSEFIIGSENSPLPVELTSFTAKVIGGKVNLNWATATEVNNYGFEIERSLKSEDRSLMSEWNKIGFVAGSGNSNSVKEYSFADDFNHSAIQSFNHSIRYRLKQIDNDGSFAYSKEVEIDNLRPSTFDLRQNFPNPFNPSTVISYQLPVSAQVSLKVYDVLGNEVASLVNLQQEAGSYNVTLDASTLASGTYIYRLIAGDYVAVKKMSVLK